MDRLEILDRAAAGFALVLAQVGTDQWDDPTGNEGQSVTMLVEHVIGGDRMATVILRGGSRSEGIAAFTRGSDGADPISAFAAARGELAEAFAVPGALAATVEHPAMDMPGATLLSFRTTEYALHGWDLARAIGVDDTIDPGVLDVLWGDLSAFGPMIAASGMFGAGASGDVAADAPLQVRVLDLSGRRA
jgi:uncharacterized protein (TIGR03086 family)